MATAAGAMRAAAIKDNAAAWLQQRRQAAWEAFGALPMPSSQHDEDWRRTDAGALDWDAFVPGSHGRSRTDALAAEPGVVITDLATASHQLAEPMQAILTRVAVDESKFLALWNALAQGVFVYVPPHTRCETPIWVRHEAEEPHALMAPSALVYLGEGASATLVEDYHSEIAGEGLASAATLALLEDGAELNHGIVQRWNRDSWHFATHRMVLGRGARLNTAMATFGSRLQKSYWEALLEGEGSEARFHGLAFGDGTQHLDHQSLQLHSAPRTTSSLLLRTAVKDAAKSVYSGLVKVEPQAQGTDGYVQNRNLILSDGARADSIPRLEIKANDVRCGHGATAGRIDEEQRFYLSSRGLPAPAAERIIVRGFFADILDSAPAAPLREFAESLLETRLDQAFEDGRV